MWRMDFLVWYSNEYYGKCMNATIRKTSLLNDLEVSCVFEWALKWFETVATFLFQKKCNGLPKVTTNFLWSDPTGFDWNNFEKDVLSVLQTIKSVSTAAAVAWEQQQFWRCSKQCAWLSPSSRDNITKTLRPILSSLYSIQEQSWNNVSYEHVQAEATPFATLSIKIDQLVSRLLIVGLVSNYIWHVWWMVCDWS